MEDGGVEGGGEAEEVKEKRDFEGFGVGGGGKDAESASFLGREKLLNRDQGFLSVEKEFEHEVMDVGDVLRGGSDDKEEEGELRQSVRGPRGLTAKEGEVGAGEEGQFVLHFRDRDGEVV